MSASMAAFVLNDSLIKIAAEDLNLFLVMFICGLFATSMIAAIAYYKKASSKAISKGGWKMHSLRMIGELGPTMCFLTVPFNMPIINLPQRLFALFQGKYCANYPGI